MATKLKVFFLWQALYPSLMALPLKENYIFLVAGPLAYKFVLCFTYNVCLEKSFEQLLCKEGWIYSVYSVTIS